MVLDPWNFRTDALVQQHKTLLSKPKHFFFISMVPFSKLRCLELYTTIVSLSIMIVRQILNGPKRHHPFDPDGTIAPSHLRSFEHASMSMLFCNSSSTEHGLEKLKPLRAGPDLTISGLEEKKTWPLI